MPANSYVRSPAHRCSTSSCSPIAKSTLWKVPGLRWLLDQVGAVPIVRRRDDPTKQTGANDEIFDKVGKIIKAVA